MEDRRVNLIKHTLIATVLTAVCVIFAPASKAGEADAFHGALIAAYGHYKEAQFYARRGNAMSAAFELEALQDKWRGLAKRYAGQPPAPYANDGQWRRTIDDVARRTDQALGAATAGDANSAWEQLKPIRGLITDLRRRNRVVLFSDHVDAASRAFRHLFQFRRQPPDFGNPAQVADLKARVAAAIAAYKNCRDKAPPDIAGNAQFQRLLTDSLFYMGRINVAIKEQNALSVVNILRRVVSSDNLLWMRFG